MLACPLKSHDEPFFFSDTREILCKDESEQVLRATVAAMICSKGHFLSAAQGTDGSPLSAKETLEVLDFSKRCLMPWIGIRYALWAVKHSKDLRLLLGLAARAELFDDIELGSEEANWRQVVELTLPSLAAVVEEARKLPEFSCMSVQTLKKVVMCISDGEWSKEQSVDVPVSGTGDKQIELSLPMQGGQGALHLCFERLYQQIRTYVQGTTMENAFITWGVWATDMRLSIISIAREGENQEEVVAMNYVNPRIPLHACTLPARCEHGDPPAYKLVCKIQATELHRKCLALVGFFEGKLGTAQGKASLKALKDVWRYFRDFPDLAELLRKYICRNFDAICVFSAFMDDLSYNELESIISDDNNLVVTYEVCALQALICWARNRSTQAAGLKVGDVVRLKLACSQHSDLQGIDCVVKNVGAQTVEIQQACGSGESQASSVQGFEIGTKYVYDAGQTAFIRLLKHVRVGSIPFSHMEIFLQPDSWFYASKIEQFHATLELMMDFQIGKAPIEILGKQAKSRKNNVKQQFPQLTSHYVTRLLLRQVQRADGLANEKKELECVNKELVAKCQQQQEQIQQSKTKITLQQQQLNAEGNQKQLHLQQLEQEIAQLKAEREKTLERTTSSIANYNPQQTQTSLQTADQLQQLIANLTPEQLEAHAAEKRSAVALALCNSARNRDGTLHAGEASSRDATRGSKRKSESQKAEIPASKKQKKPNKEGK